ncbi:MAG: phosphoribosylpyrophosphate synthetase [Acidobacteria bacterium]|nr:phosphoribosylpyrophosphate synthetase [Acidobacteriota bacterium]|tara:strand:+ start:1018 stop:1962 length:945 start_codon:yes stop_codon:yes gene_type:complete
MKLITGNANTQLAIDIAKIAGIDLCETLVTRFADNEIWVEIKENIRGEDVFLIQSTCNPANDNLMELLILADACKRASAGRITTVMPYYGYARQDRKPAGRSPITAKLVANMIEAAGVDRVLTMDLHAGQIQGFFDIPVDNLYAQPLFVKDLLTNPMVENGRAIIISPDAGGVPRARAIAKQLNLDIAIIDKRRDRANESEAMNVIGDVLGKQCIIVDDIIDTGGTLVKAAKALENEGAEDVQAYITHGVLSNDGAKRMEHSAMSRLVITDTIPTKENRVLRILSVANMFAEAIRRVHHDESISVLFDKAEYIP